MTSAEYQTILSRLDAIMKRVEEIERRLPVYSEPSQQVDGLPTGIRLPPQSDRYRR